MNEDELRELEKLEGPNLLLGAKPIVEMTDEELTAFVQSIRDCATQHQTLVAQNRVRDEKEKKSDAENEEQRAMFE